LPASVQSLRQLEIAGVRVALPDSFDGATIPEVLAPFCVREEAQSSAALTVQLMTGVSAIPAQPEGRLSRNGMTIAVTSEAGFWLRDPDGSVVVANPDLSAWQCWGYRYAQESEVFPGNRWLMLALWGYLTLRGGAYLHGAVCHIEGRYILFLGDSGVGKSTLSRLVVAGGGTCLTDENPFVTFGDAGRPQVHGSPRPGVNGPPAPLSGPLAAVFFLRHAPQNELRRLNGTGTARRLVGNARFFHWLPETIPLTMAVLDAIASNTPIFDFGFVPDRAAASVVSTALDQLVA